MLIASTIDGGSLTARADAGNSGKPTRCRAYAAASILGDGVDGSAGGGEVGLVVPVELVQAPQLAAMATVIAARAIAARLAKITNSTTHAASQKFDQSSRAAN
jgi:hypothetical protein